MYLIAATGFVSGINELVRETYNTPPAWIILFIEMCLDLETEFLDHQIFSDRFPIQISSRVRTEK